MWFWNCSDNELLAHVGVMQRTFAEFIPFKSTDSDDKGMHLSFTFSCGKNQQIVYCNSSYFTVLLQVPFTLFICPLSEPY